MEADANGLHNPGDLELIHGLEHTVDETRAERDRYRAALERTLSNFKLILERKPVRDAAETIAEAETALLHSPTS